MTKKRFALAIACAMLLTVAVSTAGDKAEWFDLEGCDVCSKMSAQEGLMEHMQWENHLIEGGMLSVTTVDPRYAEAFERAGKGMAEMGAKMAAGEKLHLCGFCSSMGALMMKGVQQEMVKTANGQIMLMTSNDPDVAMAIRKHGQHTIDQYAKMMQAQHAGREHVRNSGH